MGKTAKCIQMLQCLQSGRMFKIEELAKIINTNKRNIIEYRKELLEVGYDIKSVSGKDGGYQLEDDSILPMLKMMSEEKDALLEGYHFLMAKTDFVKKEPLTKVIGKICASSKGETMDKTYQYGSFTSSSMSSEALDEEYKALESAIFNHT